MFEKKAWYPPAETKIPFAALLAAFKKNTAANPCRALCDSFQFGNCVTGSSGRALLASLLQLLHKRRSKKRNEILIPGYTCYSVAASAVRAGLKIAVYDIDPATLSPDPDSAANAAGGRTLAIVAQHLFGIPTRLDAFSTLARKTGAWLIEDAAQALGGRMDGTALGQSGDFGLYSFGRGKPLPLGTGGVLTAKDHVVAATLLKKASRGGWLHLMDTFLTTLVSKPALYWLPEKLPLGLGKTVFDPGFKIAPMPAAVARLALTAGPFLAILNRRRRALAAIYSQAFDRGKHFPVLRTCVPVFTRFPVMAGKQTIPPALMRLGVRRMYPQAIAAEKTIRPYLTGHLLPTPGADEIAANLITLPTHSGIHAKLAGCIAAGVKRQYPC